jgi:F420-non-reducing hydrogenase small subunit
MSEDTGQSHTDKPVIGFYWGKLCEGCEGAVGGIAQNILDAVHECGSLFWPVALDLKRREVEEMPDGFMLASFINGSIRTIEQEQMARLLARKSRMIVAFGACAHLGAMVGVANIWERSGVFRHIYRRTPGRSNGPHVEAAAPGEPVGSSRARFYDTVRALHEVIDVDYYVPGCSPTSRIILSAIRQLVSGDLPPKGSVLAPDVPLCEECPYEASRPPEVNALELKPICGTAAEKDVCLLAQGVLCMGPATRGGCDALCILYSRPCGGCFGPTTRGGDYAVKVLSAVTALVEQGNEHPIRHVLESIPDPLGIYYRYSIPAALKPHPRFRVGVKR